MLEPYLSVPIFLCNFCCPEIFYYIFLHFYKSVNLNYISFFISLQYFLFLRIQNFLNIYTWTLGTFIQCVLYGYIPHHIINSFLLRYFRHFIQFDFDSVILIRLFYTVHCNVVSVIFKCDIYKLNYRVELFLF